MTQRTSLAPRPDLVAWMLRLSDAAALAGLIVTGVLFWTLVIAATGILPLSPLLLAKGIGTVFASTIVFAWISGHIRDTHAR